MTAKIDWYREVLELEPNSKVFFPLARLVANDGDNEEAMRLLEKGLERHPEYLEARLFRIELLHQAGRKKECNAEIAKLSKMFASYAGFWQAWAACLASEQGQSDTASLIRFLAAHFVSGPLQLHEVLNRGLDAMLRERQGTAPQITTPKSASALAEPEDAGEPAADSLELEPAYEPEPAAPDPVVIATEPEMVASPATEQEEPKLEADDIETNDQPLEAAEAFMADTGAILDDLDAELESVNQAQGMESAVRQDAPTTPEPEALDIEPEPETLVMADEHVEREPLAPESPLADNSDAETPLTEMDEIPAIVVSDTDAPAVRNAPDAEPGEESATSGQAAPTDDLAQEEIHMSGLEEAADTLAASAAPEPLADFDLEETVISESAPEAMQPEESEAGLDLEADMQAVLAEDELEPVVNVVENISPELELEPEQAIAEAELESPEAIVKNELDAAAAETATDDVDLESESASASVAPSADLESGIEPEIAAQLSGPEADFFAAPLQQPQAAPATLAEAEAAMVDGLDLPDMDLPAMEEPEAAQEDEALEEPEEPFSLRTRSMAEVLAEQGDIQGALDIYEELAAAATSGDELEDINRRVATLRGRLTIANASANFNAAEEANAAQNNKKLISMLEALAQRVEARAQ